MAGDTLTNFFQTKSHLQQPAPLLKVPSEPFTGQAYGFFGLSPSSEDCSNAITVEK